MKDFRELNVWEKAHQLTIKVYHSTDTLPREEMYSLTSQMRRSCASIPINIAEGCGRYSDAELARFLEISMGSASVLEHLMLLTHDLKLLNKNRMHNQENCCRFIYDIRHFTKSPLPGV